MPILNRAAELQSETAGWRRHLHENPELLYDVHETAAFVEGKLREFGCDEIVPGIGKTGVVGIIKGNKPGPSRTIGLRADMDALPIFEETGKEWASKTEGKMHACGHDGHTSMLLGAAKYLSETRNFSGAVAVIFQPAEEGGAGALAMIKDGLMDRFNIEEVYGMHNMPGLPVGEFSISHGAVMAATDEFEVVIQGKGGHAAYPHVSIDPILTASYVITALQSIASRNVNPLESVVLSVTTFHAGTATNIIPDTATISGTIRTLNPDIRDLAGERFKAIVTSVSEAQGCSVKIQYDRNYPVTANHDEQTDFAISIAKDVVGSDKVTLEAAPSMGGEDFSYMMEERPGSFVFVGNGASANLHHPEYDFNDEVIPVGISYWVKLVETKLAV